MEWRITDSGDYSNMQEKIKAYEQSLRPGEIAEIIFEPGGNVSHSIRQKIADHIERDMEASGRLPWSNQKQMVFYSWIDKRIAVRWTVPSVPDSTAGFAAAISTATWVVIIIASAVALYLVTRYLISYWRFRAGSGPPPQTVTQTLSRAGITALLIGLIIYIWSRYIFRPSR